MFLNTDAVLHYLQLCILLGMWLLALTRKYFWIFNKKKKAEWIRSHLNQHKGDQTGSLSIPQNWKIEKRLHKYSNSCRAMDWTGDLVVGDLTIVLTIPAQGKCKAITSFQFLQVEMLFGRVIQGQFYPNEETTYTCALWIKNQN